MNPVNVQPDPTQPRPAQVRWVLLLTLNNARPVGAGADILLGVVQRALYPDATINEIRRELDYLQSRSLVSVTTLPTGLWIAKLERCGVDVAEYTVDCDPGIARPAKYW
jgi:hypothetical protein